VSNERLHFCIHGAGGLGSVIGGYLALAGFDTTLISRPAHVKAINENGLNISGARGSHNVVEHLTAVAHPREIERDIDFYILLTKVKDSAAALFDAATLAPKIKCALTLQNGLGKESHLIESFGADKVIGGSIIEGGTMTAPGMVHNHVTVPTTAYFGELDGDVSERAEKIAEAFTAAGLGAQAVANIEHVIWEKAVQVGGASIWSASTLLGNPELDYWDGLAVEEGARHYVEIANELLAVSTALGFEPQNFFAPLSKLKEIKSMDAARAVKIMTGLGRERQVDGREPVRTSMHGDLLNGRKTEIDVIIKPIIDAAAQHRIPVPTMTGAYRVIKTIESYLH
jgi:2-dehydropantoate 2-reductase